MIKQNKKSSGTTLIEILFYFVIVGVLLFVAMNFAIQILNVSKQSENAQELQANINFMSQKIVSTVQTAESIDDTNSIFDNDQGKLSLNLSDALKTPTSFYISNGDVFIKEGSSAAIKINSASINCLTLRFQKVTYNKAPDQIIIDAVFEVKNVEIINLEQTLPFHTSVSLRKI
jgi:Tfp pilus assembly protein PilE